MAESLIKLDIAIAAGNAADVDMICHNCAGTSANCGMVAVVDQLRELERMGRENDLEGTASLTAEVHLEFERIEQFLDAHFEPLVTQ